MRRLIRFSSAGLTTVSLLSRRLRLVLFFSRMWLWPDLRRLSLPFFLTSKRPAAPWWVFIFGIRLPPRFGFHPANKGARGDRKSTRLNSSHTVISYAVFCL